MALPSAILTKTITFGPFMDYTGTLLTGTVTFTPSRPVVWTATGTPIYNMVQSVSLGTDGSGSIILPCTDQAGFSDGAGNSVTGWTYTARVSLTGATNPAPFAFLVPKAATSPIDLDLMIPVSSSTGTVITVPGGYSGGSGGTAEYQLITVGLTGSGAQSICDGVADNIQIQAAIDTLTGTGGGVIRIFSGLYDIQAMLTVPRNPKIRIEGQYTTKAGYGTAATRFGGTTLLVNAGLATKLPAIIKEAGVADAQVSNAADFSHASEYSRLILDGNDKAVAGMILFNTDHQIVSDCKFVQTNIGIDGQFVGNTVKSDYAGGLRVQASSFLCDTINIQMSNHTQNWITDSWFLGSPSTCHIRFLACNKIHISNNEFNSVSGSIFVFDDLPLIYGGNCGDINITGGFMDAGPGKNFWTDNRSALGVLDTATGKTSSASRGIIISGVRMVSGVVTKLFNQAKNYQAATYAASATMNFADEIVLLNGGGAVVQLTLPSAATAINPVWVKAIAITNTCSVKPATGETIESAGALVSTFTFAEVNESVLFTPDGNKWRALNNYKPALAGTVANLVATGGGGGGGTLTETADVTTELTAIAGGSTATLTTASDVVLVNAQSGTFTVTLPGKAAKVAALRKSLIIKVINSTFPVTIAAATGEEIDNSGQTTIVVNDLRAVTFYGTIGSRWRSSSSFVNNRIGVLSSGATVTPTADASDVYTVTALAVATTINAPSGTPVNGQVIRLRIVDNGTARALTWNAIYRPIGVTLPTTTVAGKHVYLMCIYNAASVKWDVLQVSQE